MQDKPPTNAIKNTYRNYFQSWSLWNNSHTCVVIINYIPSPIFLQMESDSSSFPLRFSSKLPNSVFSEDDVRSFSNTACVFLLVNFLGSNMSIIEKEIRWPDVVFTPDSWYSSIFQTPVVFLCSLTKQTESGCSLWSDLRRFGQMSVDEGVLELLNRSIIGDARTRAFNSIPFDWLRAFGT